MTSPAEHAATVREARATLLGFDVYLPNRQERELFRSTVAALAARADEPTVLDAPHTDFIITKAGTFTAEAVERLAARADELERRMGILGDETIGLKAVELVCDRAERAEARADELERERDEREVLLADAKDALECRLYAGHMPLGTPCNYPEEPMCDRCALLARIEELEGRA